MSAAQVPVYDRSRGHLRLAERHLRGLAAVAHGRSVDADMRAALVGSRLLREDGAVPEDLAPLATTIEAPRAVLRVRRLRAGVGRGLRVRWGADAMVATGAGDDDEQVSDVLYGAPTVLARTLWRLLELDPAEPLGGRDPVVGLSPDELLAPFQDVAPGRTWAADLGASTARLLRVEVDRARAGPPGGALVVADLGDAGLWSATSDGDGDRGLTLGPTGTLEIFGKLAAMQAALVVDATRAGLDVAGAGARADRSETGGPAGTRPDEDPRGLTRVEVPAASVAVQVPTRWELLDGPLDQVVLAARQVDAQWFRVNLTVAVDHGAFPSDASHAGRILAGALEGGELVAATDDGADGWLVTVVHRAGALDVVTTQRQLRCEAHTAAVSVTWAVEQEPLWRGEVRRLLDGVEHLA